MSSETAPIVLHFTSESQAREVTQKHFGDNGCAQCPPMWSGSVVPLPDSKRCPLFQSAITYLSAPIEPEPVPVVVLPEVRFDAMPTASMPRDATQVFAAVIDLDPRDFYRTDETGHNLAGANR